MKRFISMLCVLSILFTLLSGCGGKTSEDVSETSVRQAEKSETGAAASSEDKFKDHIEFTFGTLDAGKDDEFNEFIQKKFNVTINWQPLDWNNWDQQVNTMMASGDIPDVLIWDNRPWKMKEFKQWVDAGLLKELPDFSGKYPNLQSLKETMKITEYYKINGKDYLWPRARKENTINTFGSLGIIYRQDWAEKLGMYKEEYTLDDLFALAKAFAEKDPAGNGAGKTAGYADVGWAFPLLLNYFSPYGTGFVNQDGKYIWGATLPETVEGIKFIRQMYKEGALWRDFFTAKDSDGMGLYTANRLGIWSDNLTISGIYTLRKQFKVANPDSDPLKAVSILKLKGSDGKYYAQEWDNTWSAVLFSSKVDDKKLDRILSIAEWTLSEEGSRICQYGLEGKDWELKDGKVEVKWAKDENGSLVAPEYPSKNIRGLATLSGDFAYTDPNIPQDDVNTYVDSIKYLTDRKDQLNFIPNNYAMDFFSAPNKDKYSGTLSTDAKDAIKRIVASTDNVDAEWAKFIKVNESKANAVLKELNDAGLE